MSETPLKDLISEAAKTAMRAQEKVRLGVIRLILSELKQKEVDERVLMIDTLVLGVLDKMLRQRRESIRQFEAANRQDLADKEKFEIELIQEFLPAALAQADITALVHAAVQESQASTIRDMAKVMALLKPKLQGRADIGAVSNIIKSILAP